MNPPFNGWLQGFWYYTPVLLAGIALTALLWPAGYAWAGALLVALGIGMLLFFRDFPRTIQAAENELVCPADGTVVAIEALDETPHYAGKCKRVSIFMSVFNAHVNRAPFEGTVTAVKYAPGRYKNAMDPVSSKVNESNAVWMETARGPITVRQISGAIARRIVCPATPGAHLQKGEKFGMIRFGSRVEIYLPAETRIYVTIKDKVHAGTTLLGAFP